MLSRTAVVRAMSTYTRFVQRVAPEIKGTKRFGKAAKLWWATKPQYGSKFNEARAIAALKMTPKQVAKASKVAIAKSKTAKAPKKATKAVASKKSKPAKSAKKVKKVKKVKVAKKQKIASKVTARKAGSSRRKIKKAAAKKH